MKKRKYFQRKFVITKDRGLAAAELQRSLQNPDPKVAALQTSPFTFPTVYPIFHTGRSASK